MLRTPFVHTDFFPPCSPDFLKIQVSKVWLPRTGNMQQLKTNLEISRNRDIIQYTLFRWKNFRILLVVNHLLIYSWPSSDVQEFVRSVFLGQRREVMLVGSCAGCVGVGCLHAM